MILSDLFTNIETSRKLVEAGVSIPTLFDWINEGHPEEHWVIAQDCNKGSVYIDESDPHDRRVFTISGCEYVPAFTAQELSEWLEIHRKKMHKQLSNSIQYADLPELLMPEHWASFILSLISQNIITPSK